MRSVVGVLEDKAIFENYSIGGCDLEKTELKNFDVLLVRPSELDILAKVNCLMTWDKPEVDRSLIDSLGRCRLIVRNGVGVDNVDVDYAKSKGIDVRNIGDYATFEVALHALSFILFSYRRLGAGNQRIIADRKWDCAYLKDVHEPARFVVGIIGLGRIGRKVADLCATMGFKVCYFDPYANNSDYERVDIAGLAACDLVSVHCALTAETMHLLGEAFFQKIRAPICIVNTSRGNVVDFDALIKYDSKLVLLCTDVLPQEPPFQEGPLLDYLLRLSAEARLLLSPHCAFYNQETVARMRIMACEVAKNYFQTDQTPTCP